MRLQNKVALISGAARGQGAAHARRFVQEGARVVIGDVLDDLGTALADELGAEARYVHLDVRSVDDWTAAVALAETDFGKLDVLVNNAGILHIGSMVHEIEVEQYLDIISINQTGVFLGMRAALPALLRARGGSIVNISSANGMVGYGGTLGYTASKFAVRGMTKVAALEYGSANIRVNSVLPGAVDTPLLAGSASSAGPDMSRYKGIAAGRACQPDEVSNLVLFLASDEASYCTGAEYLVDGGMLAGTVSPASRAELA